MYSTIIVPSLLFLSVNGAAALSFKREAPFAGAKRDAASDFLNTLMQEMGVPANGTTNGTASAAYVPVAAAVPAAAGQPGQFNTVASTPVADGTSTSASNLTGTVSGMENDVSDLSAQLNALLAELSSTSTQTTAAGVAPVAGQHNSPLLAPLVTAQSNSSLPASPPDAQPDNSVPAPPAGAQTDDSAPPAGAQTNDSSSDPPAGLQSNVSDPSAPAGAPSVGAPVDAASLAGACGAPPAGAPDVNAPPSVPTSSLTSSATTSPTPGAQRRGSPTYGRRRLDRGLYARQVAPSPAPSGLANQVFGDADTLGSDVLAGLNALVGDLPATLQPTASAVVSKLAAAAGGAFDTLEQDVSVARRSMQSNAGHSAVFSASNVGLMTAFASMAFGAFLVL